jgi:hypothetical protein
MLPWLHYYYYYYYYVFLCFKLYYTYPAYTPGPNFAPNDHVTCNYVSIVLNVCAGAAVIVIVIMIISAVKVTG